MSTVRHWLPGLVKTRTRQVALGTAAVAVTGAVIAGILPGSAQTQATPAVAGLPGGTSAVVAAPAGPAPAAAAPAAPAPAAPAAPAPAAPAPAPVAAAPPPVEKALGYDFRLQPNYYYCGPAATRIALSVIGKAMSMDAVAKQLGTTTNGTDSAVDITRVLNAVTGGHTYHTVSIPGSTATPAQMDRLRDDVIRAITSGRAVVGNVAGTALDVRGRVHSYEGGHYLAIVGYGQGGGTVKIADPAYQHGDGSYWMTTAAAAVWMATRGYSA